MDHNCARLLMVTGGGVRQRSSLGTHRPFNSRIASRDGKSPAANLQNNVPEALCQARQRKPPSLSRVELPLKFLLFLPCRV